ncbi:MAG: hypothetical protein QOJ64_2768 [Acidobacteriota bacterium]|jgi:hypothetical protein|nr:hypothetical protein [Acidobacteriota bacterium]
MMTNKQIKVIKREERNQARPDSVDKRKPEETKRDAVTVVSEWVRELRQKKSAEGLQGFEGLFEKAA